jgi:amidohydrolase
MASADTFFLRIRGKQTHGAVPWGGVDSIVVGAQVVLGLQTIASRQMDVTQEPLILTVGTFHAGTRHNIIPDVVEMSGTLRTYDAGMRRQIMDKMALTAERIAASAGATAELNFSPRTVPAVINSPALTERMLPALRRIAGADRVFEARKQTVAEDFSLFGERLPALFLFLGVTPPEQDMASAAANHSPRFFIDESALPLGVRLLSFLALDFLAQEAAR